MHITILRGLPGVGKSTYLKDNYPNAKVCSADTYMVNEGRYSFSRRLLGDAHDACFRHYYELVKEGRAEHIAVDNVNATLWEVMPYIAVARAANVSHTILHITKGAYSLHQLAARNIHEVPYEKIVAMGTRFEALPKRYGEILLAAHTLEKATA